LLSSNYTLEEITILSQLQRGTIQGAEMTESQDTTDQSKKYHCKNCNAELTVPPGATELECLYCGHTEQIESELTAADAVEELDYHEALRSLSSSEEVETIEVQNCSGCGASITVEAGTHSDMCPYCGLSYVTKEPESSSAIRPRSLLPFRVKKRAATDHYRSWVKKRWFAPNSFKQFALKNESLEGVYLPHWTYDCRTFSQYRGERGTNYQTTERYTTTEDGKSVTKTRTVTKIRWTSRSGAVTKPFDDLLIPASDTLPRKYVAELEPWDLNNLVPFDSAYLQGYRSERYSVDLELGFESAQLNMEEPIRQSIRCDIGGDHQRINSVYTTYSDISFKHILLPVWVTAYRFKDKAYRIVINARTGEVQGERPYSWIKISGAVLLIITLVVMLYVLWESGYVG